MVTVPTASVITGHNSTTAGTDKMLVDNAQALTHRVWLSMKVSGDIAYVGLEGVDSTTGFVLTFGQTLFIPCNNAKLIWFDTAANSDVISFMAV